MSGILSPVTPSAVRAGVGDAQRGFTLIEMSIVLVIIGLIIGGIVKGEEVVANARAKSQVAQLDGIKGAVFTFQDKYAYLPGDFTGATFLGLSSVATDGDQNGYITSSNSTTPLLDTATVNTGTESPNVWLQLGTTNLLAGIIAQAGGTPTTFAQATTATYPGKTGNSYLWVATFSTGWGITNIMARLSAGSGAPTPILRFQDAYSLDAKFDDGSPGTGSILAGGSSAATGCASALSGTGASYSQAGVNASTATCVMDFLLQ